MRPADLTQELDRALERMSAGVTLDEVLAERPELAGRLRPLLTAAATLDRSVAHPSAGWRSRTRAVLLSNLQAPVDVPASRQPLRRRLALGLTAAALSLAGVGTAAAQSAQPGEALFDWKLASEVVWRSLSPDPLGTELVLLERRTAEWIHVRGGWAEDMARSRFQRLAARLASSEDPHRAAEIEMALARALARLVQAGVAEGEVLPDGLHLPELFGPDLGPAPTAEPTSLPDLPLPTIDLGL